MKVARFRLRALMVTVALIGVILALTVAALRDLHFHDFSLTVR